ncbi:UNVERIFIED_CONTAM: hypothetical protein PYX00_011800 [Menopon gallinae]|uniref:DNA mismatch repair proteins mutS family domain-containing protein n=1 Tax=Menopon gallinae TaxID=328185 RepID=A0AAW2H8F9_9NEOP
MGTVVLRIQREGGMHGPGDVVTGHVSVKTLQPLYIRSVELRVCKRFEATHTPQGAGAEHRAERVVYDRTFALYRNPLEFEELSSGHHVFPFGVRLRSDDGASADAHIALEGGRLHVRNQYFLEAAVHHREDGVLRTARCRNEVCVAERARAGSSYPARIDLSYCLCLLSTSCMVETALDREVYFSGDVARLCASVRERAGLRISAMAAELYQCIEADMGGRWLRERKLVSKTKGYRDAATGCFLADVRIPSSVPSNVSERYLRLANVLCVVVVFDMSLPVRIQRRVCVVKAAHTPLHCAEEDVDVLEGTTQPARVPLVGLSVYDTATYALDVYEFSDTLLFTNLRRQVLAREISLLLVPEAQGRTFAAVCGGGTALCEIPRAHYDAAAGEALVNSMKNEDFVLKFKCEEKYFGLSSVAALVAYLAASLGLSTRTHFSRVSFLRSETRLFMSQKTIEDLELVESISKGGPSLFSVLRATKTRMGTRLLRRSIMEPSCDVDEICARYELVRLLKENPSDAALIEKCLDGFVDADQLFSKMSKCAAPGDGRAAILAVAELCSLVYSVRTLAETLDACSGIAESSILCELRQCLGDAKIELVEARLSECVEERFFGPKSVLNGSQYIYSLRQGLNPILDLSRKMYFENLEDLERTVLEDYPEGVHLHHDPRKGYILKTRDFGIVRDVTLARGVCRPCSGAPVLDGDTESAGRSSEAAVGSRSSADAGSSAPRSKRVCRARPGAAPCGDFVYLFKRGDTLFFTTLEIQKINNRLSDANDKIVEISAGICAALLQDVGDACNALRALSEGIALLDMLFSFYIFSQRYETTIPTFGDTFIFTDSPSLFLKKQKIRKNSFYACDLLNFNVVTGSNMSGKTTYTKQAAYNAILAQIGCPVCAKFAATRVFRHILTRLSNEDDVSRGLSTFGVELSDTKLILDYADSDSLVLIDELGRGTNCADGMAFALTASEYLIEKRSYVYFITHFRELVGHLEHHSSVNVLQCSGFSIFSGVCRGTNGIEMAAAFVPKLYTDDALRFRRMLSMRHGPARTEFDNAYVQLAVRIANSRDEDERQGLRQEIASLLAPAPARAARGAA